MSPSTVLAVASSTAPGNEKVTAVLDRINDVDRLVNQKIVAKETRKKWHSETTHASDERFALAG